jgi:hypothetical protein
VKKLALTVLAAVSVYVFGSMLLTGTVSGLASIRRSGDPTAARAVHLVDRGRNVFRDDTFGDQAVWGGVLGLHKAIEGAKLGGVGPGVSPKTALALGLKVEPATSSTRASTTKPSSRSRQPHDSDTRIPTSERESYPPLRRHRRPTA